MKSRLIEGKTIRRIVQERFEATSGVQRWSLSAIQFTDGSWMRFSVIEGEGEYGIEPVYPAASPEERQARILAQFKD